MNEEIKQIATRLIGLRDVLEITPEEMAKICNLLKNIFCLKAEQLIFQ